MSQSTALVVCAGGPIRASLPDLDAPFVIAADAGAVEARRLGYRVDLLIGDMDSIPDGVVDLVRRDGGDVVAYPMDKDATDLELALDAALERGIAEVFVAGGDGGRLDHALGNALLLASARFASMRIDALFGQTRLAVVRDRREIDGRPGDLLSLYALGGEARGVRTRGLRWALDDATLHPGSSRGTSNEFVQPLAVVEVGDGVVVAVGPVNAG